MVRPAGGGRERPVRLPRAALGRAAGRRRHLPAAPDRGPRPGARPHPHRPRARRRRGRAHRVRRPGRPRRRPPWPPPWSWPSGIAAAPWRCVVSDRPGGLRRPRAGGDRRARQRGPPGSRGHLRRRLRRGGRALRATTSRTAASTRTPAWTTSTGHHVHRLRRAGAPASRTRPRTAPGSRATWSSTAARTASTAGISSCPRTTDLGPPMTDGGHGVSPDAPWPPDVVICDRPPTTATTEQTQ